MKGTFYTKMNSKILGNKLGFKSGVSKTDTDMEKLKKENAALKKTMEEMSKLKGKISDTERNRLLEKILELETQKERNDQENSSKNEEIAKLKEALRSKINTNGFSAALEEKAKDAEMIAEDLRNQITTLTARCIALESGVTVQQNSQGAVNKLIILEGQLKDALEKNQQWLVYDQQRETYVQGIMARINELEQQLGSANQSLKQQAKETSSEETQKHHKKLLLNAQKDLEVEKKTTAQLNEDLSTVRQLYEREKKEVMSLSKTLQSLQDSDRQQRGDEKKRWHDKIQRLKSEMESTRIQLDEEKKKSADLSNQIQMLQRSTLKQQEEQTRIAALEQQIHRCTSDFENEKSDRQKIQHQLYKVLKELRMAREEITRLKPKEVEICTLVWPTVGEEIAWDVSFIILDFLIPGLSIVISYTKIFKITKEMRERLITSTAYSENHQFRVSQRDYKLFRTLFLLMISFFVMWAPITIIILLLLVQNLHKDFSIPSSLFFWIMTFTFCNSVINPILYNINLFKQKWCQIIFCCSPEEIVDTDTTTKKQDNGSRQDNLSTVNK